MTISCCVSNNCLLLNLRLLLVDSGMLIGFAGGVYRELFTVIRFRVNDKWATADESVFALAVLRRWFASAPVIADTYPGCHWFAEY